MSLSALSTIRLAARARCSRRLSGPLALGRGTVTNSGWCKVSCRPGGRESDVAYSYVCAAAYGCAVGTGATLVLIGGTAAELIGGAAYGGVVGTGDTLALIGGTAAELIGGTAAESSCNVSPNWPGLLTLSV
eukprot:scaffold141491_cov99-Phaeocystis_antarctica.AAC.1